MDRGVPVRSLSRGLAVLKIINQHGAMSLMDISRTCDMPYPTASRIVQTLVLEGLIERDRRRKWYRPTGLVRSLAHGYKEKARLADVALPHIQSLTRKIGWPITISTHVGPNMVVETSTHQMTSMCYYDPEPGFSLPLLECSAGLAYLSFVSEDQFNSIMSTLRMLEVDKDEYTVELLTKGSLRQQIRAHGFSTQANVRPTPQPGKTSSISLPLLVGNAVVGTMTMTFFAASMRMAEAVSRHIADLRQAAAEIELALTAAEG
ncbi:MAG TPA: helix-turn-helix domain-containing protein [Pedomonas sp.]|uniref:helix-turn-helix domain-containing protein n=1 Tax=Pedomonas sp. TaxID=2976421 RepID=UPI002F41CA68